MGGDSFYRSANIISPDVQYTAQEIAACSMSLLSHVKYLQRVCGASPSIRTSSDPICKLASPLLPAARMHGCVACPPWRSTDMYAVNRKLEKHNNITKVA